MEGVKKLFLGIKALLVPVVAALLGMLGGSGTILDAVQGQSEPQPTHLDPGTSPAGYRGQARFGEAGGLGAEGVPFLCHQSIANSKEASHGLG
jgi:hypothetical protein